MVTRIVCGVLTPHREGELRLPLQCSLTEREADTLLSPAESCPRHPAPICLEGVAGNFQNRLFALTEGFYQIQ